MTMLSVAAFTLVHCGPGSNFKPPPNGISCSGEVSADVKKFRDDAVALLRRPELDLKEVTVQYVLLADGVEGASDSKPKLSLLEAEAMAAEVYKQALAGGDFDKLVLTHSYGHFEHGQRPGMFTLLAGLGPDYKSETASTIRREMLDTSAWRAAWRLQPGEIGAVERHARDAGSGYFVIRRLTEAEVAADNPINAAAANEAVVAMRKDAADLMDRPEHGQKRVKVRHLLVGRYFSGQSNAKKRLMPLEAEALAAELWAKAKAGEDFDKLIVTYTYDQIPGEYTMALSKEDELPGDMRRAGMVTAFGDAAWRLAVGEVGVVLYDRAQSSFGYHIIKRTE